MKLVLLGPPGAGKGTQAANLSARFDIPAISTGHIIRTAIRNETEIGRIAKEYIDRGELVPDGTVVEIVRERLKAGDCNGGFILDGFPRTVAQAQIMDEIHLEVDRVLNLEVPDETLVERLSGRRECTNCGAAFHVLYNPPDKEGVCGACGGKLVMREDDIPEVIRTRLAVYHKQTEPLKEYYLKKNILTTIEGQEELAETTAAVMRAVSDLE